MTRTLAEEEVNNFILNSKKVYRYRQEFIPDHFITVQKILLDNNDQSIQDEYIIVRDESTTEIQNFNKEYFIKLLMKEELSPVQIGWLTTVSEFRTNKCDCGSWATSNPDCHAYWCNRSNFGYGR